jgi:hypothetical protein
MKNVLRIGVPMTLSLLSLAAALLNTGSVDINGQAIAQVATKNPFPNNTETAQQFANLIEGNDTAIILNDTNIGSLNNTLLGSIGINIKEDCMKVPNSTVLYCP